MESFITKLSKHCYYGNVTNILNYYGEKISEAELVLLSGALNYSLRFNGNLFLGMPNALCEQGLARIGYQINQVDNDYSTYKSLLNNNTPILLLIKSGILTYHSIFKGTDKDHYIVLLKHSDAMVEISDSFVQTIPMSIFQGYTDLKAIRNEIQENRAMGICLEKQANNTKFRDFIKNIFVEYIKINASISDNSVICNLQNYCNSALRNIDSFFNRNSRKYSIHKTLNFLKCQRMIFSITSIFNIS
jgi:hypothetical protein